MSDLLSLDPGRNCTGWALWSLRLQPVPAAQGGGALGGYVLDMCGLSTLPEGRKRGLGEICEHHVRLLAHLLQGKRVGVVVEQMNLNTGRDSTLPKAIATGNDLLELQAIGAYMAGRVGRNVTYAPPYTWKGSASKEHTKNRLFGTPETGPGCLTAQEIEIVKKACAGVKASLHHNLYDALGIGLWATKRYRIR